MQIAPEKRRRQAQIEEIVAQALAAQNDAQNYRLGLGGLPWCNVRPPRW
jgi:hypothetical protein